jgi:uncharacterized protein YxjI
MVSFIIEQKFTLLANQYRIYETIDNQKGDLIGFAHQKRFTFKEAVDFFADEQRKDLAFNVRAEKMLDFHGRFVVNDADSKPIGAVRKAFKKSLLRSTWEIMEDNGEVAAVIQERSAGMALFRRIWNFIPVLGDMPFIFKYHFDIIHPRLNHVLGSHSKTLLWRDHYRLDIEDESLLEKIGWQTLVAQAVLLDALQGR